MDILKQVSNIGIVPVIAIDDASKAVPLAKALAAGGLPAAEVTFRTAAAEDAIRAIVQEVPEMLVGAGTVITTEQADRAMAAGATFIVAPGYDPKVTQHVLDKGGIMMPGTATAGEMQQAMNQGCEMVKFFPAEANGGVAMLKNIGGISMGLMVPIFSAFIGESIASRPGLVSGFVGGMLASSTGSGFIGGILAGFVAGYFTLWLLKMLSGLPKRYEGLKSIFLIPLVSVAFIGVPPTNVERQAPVITIPPDKPPSRLIVSIFSSNSPSVPTKLANTSPALQIK